MIATASKKEPKFILKDGHQLKEVEILGHTYYEFTDSNMAPCHRMFAGMTYYNELKMRCDRDYLMAHSQALIDCINGQSESSKGFCDITQISKLALQLKERADWIIEPESVYKYASVIFMDECENPYDYDMKYNNEIKIPRWKQQKASSFFLSKPVSRLFPPLDLSDNDLAEYLKVQKVIDQAHLQDIFTMLSSNSKTKGLSGIVELQKRLEVPLQK